MKKNALIIAIGAFLLIQPLNAQAWEATKRLTWNSGSSKDSAIAIDSNNNIYIVWADYSPALAEDNPFNYEIFYKKSTDGGTTWITKRLSWNSGMSQRPDIA